MALSVKVGTFTSNAATGNQAVTGVGFQPSLVIFFGTGQASLASDAARARFALGAATSSTARWTVGFTSEDNAAAADTERHTRTNKIWEIYSATAVLQQSGDLVSMDADGFTVNWTTALSVLVGYIALGGADLTNVKVGSFNLATGTGTQAVTGVGFQPDCVLMAQGRADTTEGNTDYTSALLGVGTSSSAQWGVSCFDTNAADTTNNVRGQRTDNIIPRVTSTLAYAPLASLSSLDSDGFTINKSVAPAAAILTPYIALKGGQFKVGSLTQPTTTGTQSITGVGFQPAAVLFAGAGMAASTSVQDHLRFALGASTVTDELCAANTATDNVATTECARRLFGKAISFISGGTPTVDSEADMTAVGSDGFTLDWTTADATAREVLYLAMGNTAVASTPSRARFFPLLGAA